jgi:hypothetical protein
VDFRLVDDKVVVRAKVNDARAGLRRRYRVREHRHHRPTAQRLGITPVTYTLSAGVGRVGLRGLQLARIDSLEPARLLRNAVSDQPRCAHPGRETEGLSPIALGYSMVIDYKTHKLTFGKHLPEEPEDFELPLRSIGWPRCGAVGSHQANFVVDTGGKYPSARRPRRRCSMWTLDADRAKVYGTSG